MKEREDVTTKKFCSLSPISFYLICLYVGVCRPVLKPTGEFVTLITGGIRGAVEQILFKKLQNHKVKKTKKLFSSIQKMHCFLCGVLAALLAQN